VSRTAKEAKRYLANPEQEESLHLDQLSRLKKALKMSIFLLQSFILKEEGHILRKTTSKATTVQFLSYL
jgi:hypothetical protein